MEIILQTMAKKYDALGDNLNKLLFERKLRPMDLARELDIPQPTIHRIVAGKSTRPHAYTLEPIAKYFDLSVEQLVGDVPLTKEAAEEKKPVTDVRFFPLLDWQTANNLDFGQPITVEKTVIAMPDLNPHCFAMAMNDSSMEPGFSKGNILIFDPEKNPKDRSHVLVKLAESQQLIFRQILIDAEHRYLKPLNPDLSHFGMRLLEDQDKVLGVLVEARRNYNTE